MVKAVAAKMDPFKADNGAPFDTETEDPENNTVINEGFWAEFGWILPGSGSALREKPPDLDPTFKKKKKPAPDSNSQKQPGFKSYLILT